jgi:16S rRNA (adenine1518-N6/adenine1519-N6)-dimethyltransferase
MKHQARKRFGQHFLTDAAVLEGIVRAIDPRPGEALVEIGPGLGALTNPLVQRCRRLTVVELDRDLAARLRKRPELTVIEADVLTVDFRALAERFAAEAAPAADGADGAGGGAGTARPGRTLRLVGNLPYNISSPILFHLLPFADRVLDQHFMLQKEVVDRMAAGPGSKTYGRLSVMLQWRYAIEALMDVPPEAFDPPPQVESAVVRMQPLDPAPPVDATLLGELVAAAFSQRRKLLRHALGGWLAQRGLDAVALGFDLQRRAEEVPVADYVALAQAIQHR